MQSKKIFESTLEEFVEALRIGLNPYLTKEGSEPTSVQSHKNLIYGMKELAKLLGCSVATAHRIKKSGILNPATAQHGKIIVIDADLALDLLHFKNLKSKREITDK